MASKVAKKAKELNEIDRLALYSLDFIEISRGMPSTVYTTGGTAGVPKRPAKQHGSNPSSPTQRRVATVKRMLLNVKRDGDVIYVDGQPKHQSEFFADYPKTLDEQGGP